ncbi:MAG: hypothetical protein ACREP6_07160 [Candidatus Binataceae bacterium]
MHGTDSGQGRSRGFKDSGALDGGALSAKGVEPDEATHGTENGQGSILWTATCGSSPAHAPEIEKQTTAKTAAAIFDR